MTAAPNPARFLWLDSLARNRRTFAYALFAAAALLAAIPTWFAITYQWQYWTVCFWGGLLALLALGGGLYLTASERVGPDEVRVLVLILGGAAGFLTVLLGIALLLYHWWNPYFVGGLEAWRANWRRLATCALAILGGLVLMFFSLLLGRVDERSNPTLRRLLYGYNTVLTCLLLLLILGLVNILAYVRIGPFKLFSRTFDWTATHNHSLSPGSVSVLEHLDKPVKVYVFLPVEGEGLVRRDIQNLLDSCRGRSDRIEAEYLSPQLQADRVRALMKQYGLTSIDGLLVAYGTGASETHEFIPRDDLVTIDFQHATGRRAYQFNGEDALMKRLRFLMEGKTKGVIYVTQGNGEPSLTGGPAMPGPRGDQAGLSALQRRLQRDNYDVRPLELAPGVDKVPEDASVVVVARPTSPLPVTAVKALTDYMTQAPADGKSKGKLVVLLDRATPQNVKLPSGLEPLLAEFNVQAGNDRVISLLMIRLQGMRPGDVLVGANSAINNPVVEALNVDGPSRFIFQDPRTVRGLPANPAGGGRFLTQELLITYPQQLVWEEKNLATDAAQAIQQVQGEVLEGRPFGELSKPIKREPVPVAVAVSERGAGGSPRRDGLPPDQPRLVVFGDASWLLNARLEEGTSTFRSHYELIVDTLAWLRERPTMGAIADAKERKYLPLDKVPPEVSGRLKWLPALLMLVVILVLGTGVWVVRRR